MPIDLYYFLASPPCRSVILVAKALKIELNLKVIELSKGDNKTPEFLKVQYEILVLRVIPGKELIRVNYYFLCATRLKHVGNYHIYRLVKR